MTDTYDLIVIGSGPGGYIASIRASQLGLKVACVEKEKTLGGTCLNVGCIPSKALLHASELYWKMCHESKKWGIQTGVASLDFQVMMKQKESIVSGFNLGISQLFKKNKITHLFGTARLVTKDSVEVEGTIYKAGRILLATGSEPVPLPFLPFDEERILSSTGALALKEIPKQMIVVGAGVIGVELGSVYQRLGSEVIFVEFMDRICPTFDESLSKGLEQCLKAQGMKFHLSSKVMKGHLEQNRVVLNVLLADQSCVEMKADVVLVAVGRRPFTKGLGLETLGIKQNSRGGVEIDGSFRTNIATIYAIGDLVDGPMLAHKASEEGVVVAELMSGQSPTLDYVTLPNVIYTDPEVASVGLTEAEAKNFGLETQIGQFPFKINSRAQCSKEEEGFVKIVVEKTTKRVLGIHILGAHASELIAHGGLALKCRATLNELIEMPYAHPTLSEAIKEAALSVLSRAVHR